jgi:hypothetical protein
MKNQINYDCAADLNFDRFSFAVSSQKGSQATSMWTLCRIKQKPFLARIPLSSTVKQCSLPSGFFTSAVLQTNQAQKSAAWINRRTNTCLRMQGTLQRLPSLAGRESSRVHCAAYGSHIRDVAATYLADLAKKWHVSSG